MSRTNYLALAMVTIVAFFLSSLWYSSALFGPLFLRLSNFAVPPAPSAPKALLELLRTFVLAYALGILISRLHITSWQSALQLGFLLWIAFPLVLLTGSILWQQVPWQLAAIHSGDWLIKLILIPVTLAVWRK